MISESFTAWNVVLRVVLYRNEEDTQSIYSSRAASASTARRTGARGSAREPVQSTQTRDKKPSLHVALYKTFWPYFWKTAFVKIFYDVSTILVPVLVGSVIGPFSIEIPFLINFRQFICHFLFNFYIFHCF